MTKSARIQEGVVEFLADGCPHTVQEIKSFLQQVGISDYSEGQFSGSINTLLRNQSIKKIDRGIYKINQNFGGKTFMKTFPISSCKTENILSHVMSFLWVRMSLTHFSCFAM